MSDITVQISLDTRALRSALRRAIWRCRFFRLRLWLSRPYIRFGECYVQFTGGRGTNHGHLIFWPYRTIGQLSIRFAGTRWFGLHWSFPQSKIKNRESQILP